MRLMGIKKNKKQNKSVYPDITLWKKNIMKIMSEFKMLMVLENGNTLFYSVTRHM